MFTVTVSAAALRRVSAFVSSEAFRPVLHGVLLEPSGILVATDGYTMLVERNAIVIDPDAPAIPSRPVLLRVPASLLRGKVHTITFTVTEYAPEYAVEIQAESRFSNGMTAAKVFTEELAGPFPNWRQVLPAGQRPDANVPTLDARLLGRFSFNGKDRTPVTLTAGANDGAAVLVSFSSLLPDTFGLIMPCQGNEPAVREVPAWVKATAPKADGATVKVAA